MLGLCLKLEGLGFHSKGLQLQGAQWASERANQVDTHPPVVAPLSGTPTCTQSTHEGGVRVGQVFVGVFELDTTPVPRTPKDLDPSGTHSIADTHGSPTALKLEGRLLAGWFVRRDIDQWLSGDGGRQVLQAWAADALPTSHVAGVQQPKHTLPA